MFLSKKWMAMLMVITTILFLVACGDKKESEQTDDESIYDNPRNHTAEDFISLSEGLEKHPVWFKTDVFPTRKSTVNHLYVFDKETVTHYWNFSGLQMEKINDLTDDELIKYVKENSRSKTAGKYTLDITLDELGQSTKEIRVILENGTSVWTTDLKAIAEENYYSNDYSELKKRYPDVESYQSALKTGEEVLSTERKVEIEGEEIIFTDIIEDGESLVTFIPGSVNQKIFDTIYSGLGYDEYYSLFTRVDDSFVGFKLDEPNTKKKNVTIEGE